MIYNSSLLKLEPYIEDTFKTIKVSYDDAVILSHKMYMEELNYFIQKIARTCVIPKEHLQAEASLESITMGII